MRNFFNQHWKAIVAILLAIVLAMLTTETRSSALPLPARLQAHAQALAPDAPHGAARHVETSLRRYGYAPRLRQAGAAQPSIEVAVANLAPGAQPGRIFIVGARLGQDGNAATAAVLELARAARALRPAPDTEIRFVFFLDDATPTSAEQLAVPGRRGGGHFIAYVGSRESSRRVSQALASLRSERVMTRHGLAAPAHVMGATLSGHVDGVDGDRALVITDAGFLRYPYFRAYTHMRKNQPDYDAMARVVTGLARTLKALAGPVEA